MVLRWVAAGLQDEMDRHLDSKIGAFATTRQGLLTRNPADFTVIFPSLAVVTPA